MKKSSQFRLPFRIPSVFKKRETIVSLLIFLGLFIILPLLISGVYYQLDDRSRASLDDVITPPNVITPPQDCEGDNCQPTNQCLSEGLYEDYEDGAQCCSNLASSLGWRLVDVSADPTVTTEQCVASFDSLSCLNCNDGICSENERVATICEHWGQREYSCADCADIVIPPMPNPDLVITKLQSARTEYQANEPIAIELFLKNQGNLEKATDYYTPVIFRLDFYSSADVIDGVPTADPLAEKVTSEYLGIRPNEELSGTFTLDSDLVARLADHTITVFATVDTTNVVEEMDETNNTLIERDLFSVLPNQPTSQVPVLDVLSTQETFIELVSDQVMTVSFSGVENFAGVSQYQVAIDDGEFSEPRNFDPLYLDTSDPLSYQYAVAFPLSTFTDGRHVLKFRFSQGEGLPTSEIITYMFTSHIIPDDCREQRFDWDVDGWVTVLDHGRFLDRWKQFDETTLVGDFNCDQQVNVLDYGAFLSAWKEQLY